MLDDNDIKKLKENFVTKTEFEGLLEIVATKDDLTGYATKDDITNFKDEILTQYDKILQKLEPFTKDKEIGDVQDKRKTDVLKIHNKALNRNKILLPEETLQIDQMQAF